MKLCKACQQPNRTKRVYCCDSCKEQFQAQKKADQEKVYARHRLVNHAVIHPQFVIDGLPTPENFSYGEVINSLILRVHATSERRSFNGYWHPSASDPIIVALGHFKQKIGDQKIDYYGYNKLKNVVREADCDVIQYLWLVLVSDFLFSHFHDNYFGLEVSAKIKGCISDDGRGPLYSSGDKGQITNSIGGKVKGIVPQGCSLDGIVLGMTLEETKDHAFSVGESFYADIQRCPFSSGFHDSNEFYS